MTGGADAGGFATLARVSAGPGSWNAIGSPLQLGSPPSRASPWSTSRSSCGSGFAPAGMNENAYITMPSSATLFAPLRVGKHSPYASAARPLKSP